jgi:apolipoprotein N-acyltransferase
MRGERWKILAGLPAAWCLLEYVRSFLLSGFGWNPLGHTQWNWIPLIQIAELTGVYGVSFLVVLGNVALFLSLSDASNRLPLLRRLLPLAVAALCLGSALLYGQLLLSSMPTSSTPRPLSVALVQGNIPQPQKWDEAFREAIWKRYEQLTRQAAQARPDLIVWPETAVPGFLQEPAIAQRLLQIVRSAGVPFLVGVPTEDPNSGRIFNSALLLAPDGSFLQRYDKLHLVPFGEFIPLEPIFGWLRDVVPIGDFSPGKTFTLFSLHTSSPTAAAGPSQSPPARFSVLICFEDIFPGLARTFVREGAQVLFVLTNDAWFGRSAASLQHLQASVFRAVENRVWIARAANTGWTGFVDPWGRRLPPPGQIARFRPGIAQAELPLTPRSPSPYTRWGDGFLLVCLLLAAGSFPRPSPPPFTFDRTV